jgi:RNA polymerase sigma-70 factor (ECF subfamily)
VLSHLRRRPSSDPKQAASQGALVACVRAFDEEFDFVFRALRRFGLPVADAEDVAQDVFVVMLRRWADFDPARPLRPWLLGITHKVALRHLRRTWRETPSGFLDLLDEAALPEDQVTAKGTQALVGRALLELKDKQRELLVLHELEGMPMQDIAAASGEPLQTLYSRLKSAHRSFARIIRRLGRFEGAAVVLPPTALLTSHRVISPPSVDLRRRALERAGARVKPVGATATPSPTLAPGAATRASHQRLGRPRPRLFHAAMATLVAAGGLALVATARLVRGPAAADNPRGAAQAGGPDGLAPPGLGRRAPIGRGRPRATFSSTFSRSIASTGTGRASLQESLGTNLVGYWRFDEVNIGKGARDFSGNGTDCVLRGHDGAALAEAETAPAEGPLAEAGPLGAAVTLDGRTWLECPQPRFAADRSDELSIALWVRPTHNDRYRTFVTRQLGEGISDHFFLGLSRRQVLLKSNAFGGRILGPELPLNVWTHIVATWRSGSAALYINGSEVGRITGLRTPRLDLHSPLMIGAGVDGPQGSRPTQVFRGSLDELLVYDRALGADEVLALAAGTQPSLSR